jgi:type IV pili sensor histidine kinase/response regulator
MFIAAVCLIMVSPQLHASEVQVGRYTLRSATPTRAQADLMATIVTTRFPVRIQTIGEAVRYLLRNGGYRLASPVALDPETRALFRLPLPAVHRNLGPLTLRQALETLAGPTFRLVQDPVHRLVAFELCAKGWGRQGKHEAPVRQSGSAEGGPTNTDGRR